MIASDRPLDAAILLGRMLGRAFVRALAALLAVTCAIARGAAVAAWPASATPGVADAGHPPQCDGQCAPCAGPTVLLGRL